MLPLKRAVANIDRSAKTRITEQDESRAPRFYVRRLLMNFDPADVRSAWTLESSLALYGFEFIARARFHDLNLGPPALVGADGQATLIAGDDKPKRGFALCGGCGKVQRGRGGNAEGQRPQEHTPDCQYRHDTAGDHLLEDIFLYREFESECLRILVPKGFGSGDRTTYSFMSALQLGLRRRFGGKADHLRFDTMTEAGLEGGAGKTYILIYDSVPGGTGYLQQLLAGAADTLIEVLAAAHGVIRDCGCQDRPDEDGCYQCVFHYRQGRHREHISRAAALEMLDELVEGQFRRKQVPCLSEIYIHPSFGSELERRFLPALKALGGQFCPMGTDHFPAVQISQEIKAGRTAYLLTVGGNRYWVETQVPIEDPLSGLVLCQPDFLISPTKAGSPMRPIAVFVDGWEYHRQTLAEDARKRATLMLRGDYRVWPLTYEDIEAALQLKGGTDLDNPLAALTTASGQTIPADWLPRIPEGTLPFHAIAWLLWLLGRSEPLAQDPLRLLEPAGRHLLCRTLRRRNDVTPAIEARSRQVLGALPDWLLTESLCVHLHSPAGQGPWQWVGKADPRFLTGKGEPPYPLAGAWVLDDAALALDQQPARAHWRQWLRLANLLQAIPGVALLTEGLLAAGQGLAVPPPQAQGPLTVGAAWKRILDEVEFLDRLKFGFVDLANRNLPAPDEIGAEIEDDQGYRIAEAVWPGARVVLLTTGQTECADLWRASGFAVVVEGEDWWRHIDQAIKERTK